jgi:dihydropteroate synthase
VTALAAAAGAWGVRVHEVPDNVDAVRVATAWRGGSPVTPDPLVGQSAGRPSPAGLPSPPAGRG